MIFYAKFKEAERLGVRKGSRILESMYYTPNAKISQYTLYVNAVSVS